MGLFKRFKRVCKAKANKAMSLLENEEELLEQSINEIDKELSDVNNALINAVASELDTKNLMDEAEDKMKTCHRHGENAMSSGNEEAAKEYFSGEYTYKIEYDEYKKMYESIKTQNEKLKEKIRIMNKKRDSMIHKKDVLIAKIKVAKAQKQIMTTYNTINPDSAAGEFTKIEKKVKHMENEVAATDIVQAELEPQIDKLDAAWEDASRDSFVQNAMNSCKTPAKKTK